MGCLLKKKSLKVKWALLFHRRHNEKDKAVYRATYKQHKLADIIANSKIFQIVLIKFL